jgi:hypothetical protein
MASFQNCPSIHALRCPVTSCIDVRMLNVSIVFKEMASLKSVRAVFFAFRNLAYEQVTDIMLVLPPTIWLVEFLDFC